MRFNMNCLFVLAILSFGNVAPFSYQPRYLNNDKSGSVVENQNYQNAELINRHRNVNEQLNFNLMDQNIPHSLHGYMSPVPTLRDSRIISETDENDRLSRRVYAPLLLPSNKAGSILGEKEMTEQVLNKNEKPVQFQIPRELVRSPSYSNPSSIVNDKEIIGNIRNPQDATTKQILTQNSLILNKLEEISQNVNEKLVENAQTISEKQGINYFLPNSNNGVPVATQGNPQLKSVPEPFLIETPVHETYHPTIYVGREKLQIPSINVKQIESVVPVSTEQNKSKDLHINNQNQQIYSRPIVNGHPEVVTQKYNVEHMIANRRLQDVLSSTKHKKRYLAIHPDGRVEHLDHLESIIKSHPNYVLVNAGQIITNDNKRDAKPEYNVGKQTLTSTSVSSPQSLPNKPQVSFEHQTIHLENVPQAQSLPTMEKDSTEPVIKLETTSESLVPASPTPASIIEPKEILATSSASSLPETEASQLSETVPDFVTDISVTTEASKSEAVGTSTATINIANSPTTITDSEATDTSKAIEPEYVLSTVEEANSGLVQNAAVENKEQILEEAQHGIGETKITADTDEGNTSGTPIIWFNTSDPTFWDKLTEGKDDNVVYFFQMKSRPRVEKEILKTLFPDGTIKEELTESVWYENDEEPTVMKTTRVIPPDAVSTTFVETKLNN